jgi:hypothetical protein
MRSAQTRMMDVVSIGTEGEAENKEQRRCCRTSDKLLR